MHARRPAARLRQFFPPMISSSFSSRIRQMVETFSMVTAPAAPQLLRASCRSCAVVAASDKMERDLAGCRAIAHPSSCVARLLPPRRHVCEMEGGCPARPDIAPSSRPQIGSLTIPQAKSWPHFGTTPIGALHRADGPSYRISHPAPCPLPAPLAALASPFAPADRASARRAAEPPTLPRPGSPPQAANRKGGTVSGVRVAACSTNNACEPRTNLSVQSFRVELPLRDEFFPLIGRRLPIFVRLQKRPTQFSLGRSLARVTNM